jgi:hypothetical protein
VTDTITVGAFHHRGGPFSGRVDRATQLNGFETAPPESLVRGCHQNPKTQPGHVCTFECKACGGSVTKIVQKV